MSNSTTLLDTISVSQASKEVTANAMFDAASPAMIFGRRASTTTALTWAYYGGRMLVDGVLTAIANGTVVLTASTTNYVEATRAGVVSKNTTGFTAGSIPLYTIVTGASTVTSYTDERAWVTPDYITHDVSVTVATADVTLTAAQARVRYIIATGTLTGNRAIIVPNKWEGVVYNGCSGAFTLTVKTSGGTGIDVTATERFHLYADGTNVELIGGGGSSAPIAMDDLTDVDMTGIANGDVLVYDTATSTWLPAAATSGTLAGLTDVDTTGVADNDVLSYDSATSKWIPTTPTGGTGTIGKQAIPVMAGSISPSVTGGCAALAKIASAANQPDIVTLDFDATTQEYAQFSVVMPKKWNEGTVTFKAHWSHAATTTNFGVVWDLQAVAVSDDDAIAVAFGTAQTSTDTGGTTNDLYTSPESSAITVAGTPAAEDMVFFRLSRVTGNGSDTMAIDARLHGITLYITTDAETDA